MPITARPDPNNPNSWIWVDSATGEPAIQPGGSGTPYVAPNDATDEQRQQAGLPPKPKPPEAAPAAPAPPTAQAQAQGAATTAAQNPPSVGAGQAPGGMFTPDQLTKQNAAAVQQANLNVAAAWDEVNKQQQIVQKMQDDGTSVSSPQAFAAASQTLDTLYTKLTSAEQNVQTANVAYGQALDKAIVDPSQATLQQNSAEKAKADADYAGAQAKVLTDGAPGQRAYVAAQAGQASATAAAQEANAQATLLKAGPEADQLTAQAKALSAQANQTNALLPGLLAKQQADLTQTEHQTALTDSTSDYYKAQTRKADADTAYTSAQTDYQKAQTTAGIPAATAAELQARGASEQATAQKTLEDIQKAKLGTTYGLQDQINAIKSIQQQVFGPGGSGDPNEANDLLQQFTTAAIGGTTPFEAAKAVAGQQSINYGTQMAGVNALQQAQATRAGQYANLAGGALGTLAQMNAYAPKGSTAMAGAFQSVMDAMANRLAQPQFAATQIPNAPAMPSFLQGFSQGNTIGQQQGAARAQPPPGQAGQSPTINVNVNGQPQAGPMAGGGFNPQASTAAMNQAGFMDTPQGRAAMAQMLGGGGGAPAAAAAPMPAGQTMYGTPPPVATPSAAAGSQTPQQSFMQGLANAPTYTMPNVLSSYGLNMPSPMAMLGGQSYVGMGY